MGKDARDIEREIEATRSRMGDTVEALGYKADVPSRVGDAVRERVETVKGTLGRALGTVRTTTTQAATTAASSLGDALPDPAAATRAAQRGAGIAAENPLGLALGALAVGFLAGLAAPVTDLERERIGPIRDDLVERAQSVAGEALEHGRAVLAETAQAAMETAQRSAQEHGKQMVETMKSDSGDDSSGQQPTAAGMPADRTQGGGLRGETLMSGGTGAQTPADRGTTTTQYGALLDDAPENDLSPGAPGTASP